MMARQFHFSITSVNGLIQAAPLKDYIQASDLPASGVAPGTYTFSTVTVDSQGRVTAASSGSVSVPVTSVFGRTGAVAAASADYTAAQVTNAADLTAANTFTAVPQSVTVAGKTLKITSTTTIETSNTQLILQQTGDTFGTSRLRILNTSGFAGCEFANDGLSLVDMLMTTKDPVTWLIRLENRGGSQNNLSTPEFQFGLASAAGAPFCIGTLYAGPVQRNSFLSPTLMWANASSTTFGRSNFSIISSWVDSTDATRKCRATFNIYDTVAREAIRVEATGTAALVGIGGAVDPNGALLGVNGQISVVTAGKGLSIKTGSNCKMGTGALVGGTATVSTTAVTASSLIFLTDAGGGVLANIGSLYLGTITAGTSFVVNSSNVLDTSNFNWLIVEPA